MLGPEHPEHADFHEQSGRRLLLPGQVRAGRGALTARPWRSSAACWVPSIPTRCGPWAIWPSILLGQGKYAQAEALFSQTLEIQRRVLGPEHASTLMSMDNLASVQYVQGKYAQAQALFNQTLEVRRRVLGPDNPDTLETLSAFAAMYLRQGNYDLARLLPNRPWRGADAYWVRNTRTQSMRHPIWRTYHEQGKFADGRALAREAMEMDRKKRPNDWEDSVRRACVGANLAGLKKYAEAEPLLLGGYSGMNA